jgi:Bacterial SCP ortholog
VTDAADDPVSTCLDAYGRGERPERAVERAAVRRVLDALVRAAPGRSVEVRVPPHAVVQAVPGPAHRRGTPPAVVETDAPTLLGLAVGRVSWHDAVADGRVRAAGERSDLSGWFPLPT